MKQFNIHLRNRPGALAEVTEMLSKGPVNLEAISSDIRGDEAVIRIVTNDETTTRTVLNKNGRYFTEADIFVLNVSNRPGELAKRSRKLANSGVNIESIYLLNKNKDTAELAISVNDTLKARSVLG